jgi:phytanoyl-CoA hydroxylase
MNWTENRELIKSAFDRAGYVCIPEFFSSEEAEDLRRQTDRYIEQVVPNAPVGDVYYETPGQPDTIKQLIRMNRYDAYFARLIRDERFVKLAELLLDSPVIDKNMQWFNKPAGNSRETPPHQDGYYFMLEPNSALTMWLALDEVTEENGCVRYLPGSHLGGLRAHERTDTPGFSQAIPDYDKEERNREQPMPAKPGDLLIHHSLTIHRAEANMSTRRRRALGIIYYSAQSVEDTARVLAYAKTIKGNSPHK